MEVDNKTKEPQATDLKVNSDHKAKEIDTGNDNYKSPVSFYKEQQNNFEESAKKNALDINVSPLCKDFFQHMKKMNN